MATQTKSKGIEAGSAAQQRLGEKVVDQVQKAGAKLLSLRSAMGGEVERARKRFVPEKLAEVLAEVDPETGMTNRTAFIIDILAGRLADPGDEKPRLGPEAVDNVLAEALQAHSSHTPPSQVVGDLLIDGALVRGAYGDRIIPAGPLLQGIDLLAVASYFGRLAREAMSEKLLAYRLRRRMRDVEAAESAQAAHTIAEAQAAWQEHLRRPPQVIEAEEKAAETQRRNVAEAKARITAELKRNLGLD